MAEPDDLELIRRFESSDLAEREKAFGLLFARHQRRAFELAYRVLGEASLASDAVQEAFLTVYQKGARFEARSRFSSWLYRVVMNQAIDLRRRERRFRTAPLGQPGATEDGEVLEPEDPRAEEPADFALAAERAEAVRLAITRLSPKLAEVAILRYPEGLSYEEIGEILGVPPGTVKSRLNRAHSALREMLDDDQQAG